MKIVQILPTLSYGDAIGNDVLAIAKVLSEMGVETGIYAENIDSRIISHGVYSLDKLPNLNEKDIAILHLSIGADCNYLFSQLKCIKVTRYHNITPSFFFKGMNSLLEKICRWAFESVEFLADKTDYCLADSEFNKIDLENMGYTCPIDVVPILIRFKDYEKKPSKKILEMYDGQDVVLFTGRIAPNKKIQDVINAFCSYKRNYNPKAKLILVGGFDVNGKYYKKLIEYSQRLGVKDVIFTNHIPFDEVLAYFHVAKVFLCQSEHEGFCVPLVEAMYFDIPIIAYSSSAIPYTMGGSGIVMESKEPELVAGVMHRLMTDERLRKQIIQDQRVRIKDFDHDIIKEQLKKFLSKIIDSR